jgi:NAD(P)-dependent dehydrogenase (short-subunit alcohol dehydrogenase family)
VPVPPPIARAVDAMLEASVVLSFSQVGHEVRSRLDGWRPLDELEGTGRRALITGANSGLGYATAAALLRSGVDVVLLVRDDDKAASTTERLAADLGRDVSASTSHVVADLLDLASVRRAASSLEGAGIDTIVHNAGAMFDEHRLTADGHERTYQLHVVAPFLLTSLLLDSLIRADDARVIFVTSGGMYSQGLVTGELGSTEGYRPSVAYARAKRAQVELTRLWARRHGDEVSFHAVHPGWALTPGVERSLPRFRRLTGPILRDPAQGADTIAWLVLAPGLPGGGALWHDRRARTRYRLPGTRPSVDALERLWVEVATDAGVAARP